MRSSGSWRPGESGNPHGRPLKSRALSTLLERADGRRLEGPDGKTRAVREMVARCAWELAGSGRTELASLPGLGLGGRILEVEDVREWLAVVSWLFDRAEGKPKRSAALLVPEDHEGPFRFTLDLGEGLLGDGFSGGGNGGTGEAGP
jgi:hypothetical protein